MTHHLLYLKSRHLQSGTSEKAYLNLKFRSVDKTIVVEVADHLFMEFEIVSYRMGDDGIGAFEYHGFHGNHSRPFVDITRIAVVSVNGEEPTDDLRAQVQDDFKNGRIWAECKELPE